MKSKDVRISLAVGLALFMIYLPVLGANAPLGKILPRTGTSQLNGNALMLETTVFSGDTIATEADSQALVQLPYGDQIHVGPSSALQVFENSDELLVSMDKGIVRARSGNARSVAVNAHGLVVRPSGEASYDVAIEGNAVYVATREGSVAVHGMNESFVVPADKTMKFELAANTAPGTAGVGAANLTPGQGAIIALAVSLGVSIPVTLAIRNELKDDIDDAKVEVCEAISPNAPCSTLF
jgi:hypothetical protein